MSTNILNLDDLFNTTHIIELSDFPTPGQTRSFKCKKLSGPDQEVILDVLYRIRESANSTPEQQIAILKEQRDTAARLVSKYVVEPSIAYDLARELNAEYLRRILDGIQGKEKELGEDSSAPDHKGNGSDGSTGAPIVSESGT